jgi:hypothetical protein
MPVPPLKIMRHSAPNPLSGGTKLFGSPNSMSMSVTTYELAPDNGEPFELNARLIKFKLSMML